MRKVDISNMGKESEAFFFNITYYVMNEWIICCFIGDNFYYKSKRFVLAIGWEKLSKLFWNFVRLPLTPK